MGRHVHTAVHCSRTFVRSTFVSMRRKISQWFPRPAHPACSSCSAVFARPTTCLLTEGRTERRGARDGSTQRRNEGWPTKSVKSVSTRCVGDKAVSLASINTQGERFGNLGDKRAANKISKHPARDDRSANEEGATAPPRRNFSTSRDRVSSCCCRDKYSIKLKRWPRGSGS